MAKDQRGHGSNRRGTAKVSVNRPVGYTVHSVGPGGKKTLTHSGTLGTVDGKTVNSRDSKVQDRVAAEALSSGGPKSAPVPVHDSMQHVQEMARFQARLGSHTRDGSSIPGYGGSLHNSLTQLAKDAVKVAIPAPAWGLRKR